MFDAQVTQATKEEQLSQIADDLLRQVIVDVAGVEVITGGGVLDAQHFHQWVQGEAGVEADSIANMGKQTSGLDFDHYAILCPGIEEFRCWDIQNDAAVGSWTA